MTSPAKRIVVRLAANPAQRERLEMLQKEFAAACNHVARLAAENRCWNRVALHHLAYRGVRERFPALGSQMACNAVYAVTHTYRTLKAAMGRLTACKENRVTPLAASGADRVASPATAASTTAAAMAAPAPGARPNPNAAFRFLTDSPVYFDRHTLSFTASGLSLFTQDGRLHFDLLGHEDDIALLSSAPIKEATLHRDAQGYFLNFQLASATP